MIGGSSAVVNGEVVHADCSSVVSSTGSTYELPYIEQDGWGVGTAYNERNFAEGKRYKRIKAADLGSIKWERTVLSNGAENFRCSLDDIKLVGTDEVANILCANYRTVKSNEIARKPTYKPDGTLEFDKTIASRGTSVLGLRVQDTSYTTAADFKAAMKGVMVYYELEEPIETELDTAPISISVKKGGTVTFTNTPQLEVPNEVVYSVPLDELEAQITSLYNSDVKEIKGL